jgi:HSP20 family molecular chaperone IbpA
MTTSTTSDPHETRPPRPVAPPVDIHESREDFLLLADLPGVQQADLTVRLDQGELSFEGLRRRRGLGELLAGRDEDVLFRRSFTLPGGIDADKIEANLVSGVLRLRIPKAAAFKPRQITVTAG